MSPSSRLRLAASALLVSLMAPLGVADTADAAEPVPVVTPVVTGLTIPWDLTWVGELMLFDERAGRLWSKRPDAAPQRVSLPLPPLFVNSEGGLLGLVADPDAATNGYFYTCMSVAKASGSASDVQVWKWRLTSDTTAEKVQVLVKGIPIGHGRHNGCRLRFRSAGMLYIGTGDAAKGTSPQSLKSLGGKILRVSADGTIPRTNPFYPRGGNARYVWNYGHRNVQGLALRPGTATNELWSVEHGTNRDDEVNYVTKGSNYGWSPTPGYNEKRSMTDTRRYPKARKAAWRSGYPTVATSGATFLSGAQWGDWDGMLAVAELKGQGILLFSVGSTRKLSRVAEIVTDHGRIRTVEQGPDGALYFTTSNGSGDGIYRLAPG
ncbi:Aldose sugar dehydrogenase YliI [Propionicimonas sp. T2.31MG-18]|uniref:PQQ-dependent sugar dehydrogenase n=1 Tax=Propionicimonas sp. T2.31MG-18 TaxID=3157620 RepID=UPI0035E6B7A1